jgi:hypothetical protein
MYITIQCYSIIVVIWVNSFILETKESQGKSDNPRYTSCPPSGIGDLSRFWLSCFGRSQIVLICWLSNDMTMSVPSEGYYRNALCGSNFISTFFFKNYDCNKVLIGDTCKNAHFENIVYTK